MYTYLGLQEMDWSFNLWLYHQGTIFYEGIDVLQGDFSLSIWIWAYGGPILFHGYVLYACGDIHVIRQLSAHLFFSPVWGTCSMTTGLISIVPFRFVENAKSLSK